MNKITFLVLHLGYGGVEKAVIDQANIFTDKYDVEIISAYKLYDNPPFKIDKRIKIRYLSEYKSNREEFWSMLKKGRLIACFLEGLKSLKILYVRNYVMKKEIKKINNGIIISTRIFYTKLLNKYGNKKIIKIAQEHRHHDNSKRYIRGLKKACKNIDYLMPVSKELTNFYNKVMKGLDVKCVYIPHFLDFFPSEVSDLNSSQLTFVGRLSPEKGVSDLLRIFKLLVEKNNQLVLNIIGDGPEMNSLKEQADKLHIDKSVIFHGFQSRKKVNQVLKDTSVYLMTSFSESFGLVLIEAASFGIPLIAFDSASGAHEIINDGENGFLISNRDYLKFANAVEKLLDDEILRKKMGSKSRGKSLDFEASKVKEKWFSFLMEVFDND